MRTTTYERFDGIHYPTFNSTSPKHINIFNMKYEEYRTTKVTFQWNKNEELIYRYLNIFYPEHVKYVHKPSITPNITFGIYIIELPDNKIKLSIQNPHFIKENMEFVYDFKTKLQKKFTLLQIVKCLEYRQILSEKKKK